MKPYTPSIPRATLGCVAASMTIVTFGLLVGVPALTGCNETCPATTLVAKPALSAPVEVAIYPQRIDVVGVRDAASPAPVAVATTKVRG